MSAISLKSITGITSITTPAGVDNQLTLHTNNTTERLKINEVGNVRVANTFDCVGVSTFRNNLFAQADLRIAGEIVHISDTDTRIQFPSNDNIAFKTAGTERLRITSGGEVKIMNTSGTVGLYFQSSSGAVSNFRAIGTNLQSLGYFFGNTERVRFGSDGKVGIGSEIPEQRLTVAGATDITHYANTTINNNRLQLGFNAPEGYIKSKNSTGSPASNLALYTTDTSGNTNKIMHLSYDGKVGINEPNPGQKLTVGGDGYFGFTTPNDAARQIIFNANRGSAGQTLANINWQWNSKFVAQIRGIAGSDTTNKDDGHLAFFTSAANNLVERLRITKSGEITVGNNITTVDTRNPGGIHIQPNNGISFKAYSSVADSRNWRIRVDDYAWGCLHFSCGDNNSTSIGDSADDVILALDHTRRVGINQVDPDTSLHIKNGTLKIETNTNFYGGSGENGENYPSIFLNADHSSGNNPAHGKITVRHSNQNTYSGDIVFMPQGYYSGSYGYEEVMRVSAYQRVGINRSPSQHPLEIQHASEPTVSLWRGTTKSAALQAQSGGTYLYSYNNAPLYFSVNSAQGYTERMKIDQNGVVTISNSSPPATGAMTFITDGGSATSLGTAATLRVANDGSSASYSVFEVESAQGSIRFANNGRLNVGDHIGNPDATLHVIGPNNAGVAAIAQFGKTNEARYARFNSINNQQNFDHLLLSRYDNSTADLIRLQNTYAAATGYGSGIGWYGHGGGKTGGIKVVNKVVNSTTSIMYLDVGGTNVMHLESSPNRVMIGQPPSAGGFLPNCSHTPLQCRPSQGNTGCFAGSSLSYTTNYGLLPWASGGTYISSGTTYNNGVWQHQSSDNTNCLLYLRGGGFQWYSSNNGSSSWNVASGTNVMNSTGQWTGGTSSDRRLKDNITNMNTSDALTKVTQLQGVSYTWKNEVQKKYGAGVYPEGTHYGFIAQDVKTVWPEAHIISDVDNESDFDDDPTKDVKDDVYYGEIEGVKMEKMVPLLVEAIKELKKENDALKARVTTLEG